MRKRRSKKDFGWTLILEEVLNTDKGRVEDERWVKEEGEKERKIKT